MSGTDRARVPFALVGVLLLVSSLTLAPTLDSRSQRTPTVDRTVDRTTAALQTAVREGVATAGREAAATPVITPSNSTVGRDIRANQSFRDALRLRVYVRVRERLPAATRRNGAVTVSASLPDPDPETAVALARRRVDLSRAGPNDTALRATVRNVTVEIRRHDRVVGTRTVSPTVVVPTPVLLVHDRVAAYQRRLDSGLGKPGLTRRLTARLYPIAWARGSAQYGGAPITNVVANRHVGLATNGALLGVQRATFGRSDPDGRRSLREATAVVGVKDVLHAGGSPGTAAVATSARYEPPPDDISTGGRSVDGPSLNGTVTVGVNTTATDAFRTVAGGESLARIARNAYTVELRFATRRTRLRGGEPGRPRAPGPGWRAISDETTHGTRTVRTTDGTLPNAAGWHVVDGYVAVVEREYTRRVLWTNGTTRRTTSATSTERLRVGISVLGRHRSGSRAPARPIRTAHDPAGSPLGGPNLADIASDAPSYIRRRGGRHRVAELAADGRLDEDPVTVTGERPAGLRKWLYRDLVGLRERLRNESVQVKRGSIGSFETNPPAKLRQRIERRRDRLVGVPATYGSAAEKARVAARLALVEAVQRRLERRADRRNDRRGAVGGVLSRVAGGSLSDLRRGLAARATRVPRTRPPPSGPGGPVRLRVDAAPAYLSLAEVDGDEFTAVRGGTHPLAVRNVNVFSVPYGDASQQVTDEAVSTADRTRLAVAATTLAAANRTLARRHEETLRARRAELRRDVARINGRLEDRLVATVQTETAADEERSRRIVAAALGRWKGTAERGRALANGSAARRVATVAARRLSLGPVESDWLALQLSGAVDTAVAEPVMRPRTPVVNRTASAAREVGTAWLRETTARATERRTRALLKRQAGVERLPAGLPVAPVPGYWYATANVWWVSVEGAYARFAVRTGRGSPSDPGASLTYARDGGTARLDVDGDGTAERLGTADRVSFRADTGVVVVVPPKPRGVGDKDGDADERSPGWGERSDTD